MSDRYNSGKINTTKDETFEEQIIIDCAKTDDVLV